MIEFRIFCAGEFLETTEALNIVSPSNQQVIAKTWYADAELLERAIAAAIAIGQEFSQMPTFQRSEILNNVKEGLLNDREAFAHLITLESGKPIRYALAEVDRSIQSFSVAAEECRRIPREYLSLDWTLAGKNKEGLVRYFPVGLVAGISPFNFPLNLAVHKIAPALAAGCPIILKPSSLTPLSTLKLAGVIAESGIPHGVVSILPMNRETGNRLVTDNRIKLLSFTGSPSVGWAMKRQAGKKKVVLELGGNAGVIISQGANLDEAVPKCVTGSFSYSGQVCIHTQRIYVLRSLFNSFMEAFVRKTQSLRIGDPLDPETDMAGMIDEANAIRVDEWVKEAISDGAVVMAGGNRVGNFYEPTILTHTRQGMKVCCEEVFGPVVIIEQVESFREAVNRVNEGCFGLQAGVFTDSIDEMNYAFINLEVGGVIINDVPTFRVDHMPYGGVKESGQGREGIRYAMYDMLEPRLLVKNC